MTDTTNVISDLINETVTPTTPEIATKPIPDNSKPAIDKNPPVPDPVIEEVPVAGSEEPVANISEELADEITETDVSETQAQLDALVAGEVGTADVGFEVGEASETDPVVEDAGMVVEEVPVVNPGEI